VISAQPTAGTGYELDAIAAVVLGGTSLAGGRGRIIGTLIGSVILGVLTTGLILLNVPFFTQLLIKGVVIILAVAIDSLKQRPQLFRSLVRRHSPDARVPSSGDRA
jgi:ribose transport system permease protein